MHRRRRADAPGVAGQHPGNARARNQIAREHHVERRQSDGAVGSHFHGGSTLTEQNHRAEHRVIGNADDQLVRVWPSSHRLYREARQSCIRPILMESFAYRCRGGPNLGCVFEIEGDPADVRLMADIG